MPTGDAYSSGHLVPPLWDLHMFYLLRPILFRTCRYFTGLRSSNIPWYFLDFTFHRSWRGVRGFVVPAGDIYFHFEFFNPSLFRTAQWIPCKWNQAWPITCIHSCFIILTLPIFLNAISILQRDSPLEVNYAEWSSLCSSTPQRLDRWVFVLPWFQALTLIRVICLILLASYFLCEEYKATEIVHKSMGFESTTFRSADKCIIESYTFLLTINIHNSQNKSSTCGRFK